MHKHETCGGDGGAGCSRVLRSPQSAEERCARTIFGTEVEVADGGALVGRKMRRCNAV